VAAERPEEVAKSLDGAKDAQEKREAQRARWRIVSMTDYEKNVLHYLSQMDQLMRLLIEEVRKLKKGR